MPETRVSREGFLRVLETVEPGLSAKETLEQSNSFALAAGEVITFNEELSIRGPSGLTPDFSGAVRADKLLNSLRKLTEEEITVIQEEGKLIIQAKRKKFWVRMEEEISLPYTKIEKPEEWSTLPDEFSEAVQMVACCCSTREDGSNFNSTCLNIASKWIEACDGMRMTRWKIKTGFKEPFSIKHASTRPLARMGVTSHAMGRVWTHFKNTRGFVLSARKYVNDWASHELDSWLEEEGKLVSLPKGLKEACDKANEFTQDNGNTNLVSVSLKATRVVIKGEGPLGGYQESSGKVAWDGPEITFMVSPSILSELVDKYAEVIITPRSLKIEGSNYTYCTRLMMSESKE